MTISALAETGFAAFVALLVILDPPGAAVMFVALTRSIPVARRRNSAWLASLLAGAILVLFALTGKAWLATLGIGLPAFRIAGGILLFLLATQMIFARHTEGNRASDGTPDDITVFPLAFPLIAGPGAMTSVILLMERTGGDAAQGMVIIGALVAALAVVLVSLLRAEMLIRLLKVTGCTVVARVMAINLAALAVQFIIDGMHDLLPLWRIAP